MTPLGKGCAALLSACAAVIVLVILAAKLFEILNP